MVLNETAMAKLLLVDDDEELTSILSEWLATEGNIVECANCGEDALSRLKLYQYDLIILDVGMPDIDGFEVCRRYRLGGGMLPIIMLTGKGNINDKTAGFDAGVDDYLTKPFHPKELNVRIKALMRRPAQIVSEQLVVKHLTIDTAARKVLIEGREIKLLPQEFALLEFFVRHPNRVFSSDEILDKVWSNEKDTANDTVRVHINKLRKKIDREGSPVLIRTIHGSGYILDQ
ncbi:response regulator transcription factor [bacterium]|nr:response regulator transcription factor [bacterium]MBP9806684.1 response regulator transcription factor [bacterium]